MYRVLKYAYSFGLTLNGVSRSSRKWDASCCPERFCFTARSQFSAFISLLVSENNCSRLLSVTPIKILLLDGIKLWFASVRYSSYLNIITVNFVEASLFSSVISPLVVHNSKTSLSILNIQKNQFWICQLIGTFSLLVAKGCSQITLYFGRQSIILKWYVNFEKQYIWRIWANDVHLIP